MNSSSVPAKARGRARRAGRSGGAGSGAARRRPACRRPTRRSARHERGPLVPGQRAQRVEVGHHLEVAVAALPRGHRVAADGVHLDVDGEQVVAPSAPWSTTSSRKCSRGQALALQPALHVGNASRTVSIVPLSTSVLSSSSCMVGGTYPAQKLERQLHEAAPGCVLALAPAAVAARLDRLGERARARRSLRREPSSPGADGRERGGAAAVASASPRSTGTPIASACSSSSAGSLVSPPSTRSASTGDRLAHRLDHVGDPPGDALERGARDLRALVPRSGRRSCRARRAATTARRRP